MAVPHLFLVPALALALLQSGGELLWEYATTTSGGEIALGQRGTLAFATPGYAGLRADSLFAQGTGTPVWTNREYLFSGPVAAQDSDEALFATLNLIGYTSAESVLHLVDSESGASRWEHTFPPQMFTGLESDVSDDGRTIASGFLDTVTSIVDVALHDPQTGAITSSWSFPPPTAMWGFDLTPDGSYLVLGGSFGSGLTQVLDTGSGQVVFTTPGGILPGPAVARHADALVVVEQSPPGVLWHTRLFQRQGASWVERLLETTPLDIYPSLAAVSADGSVAAIAWSEDATARTILHAYDVGTGAETMTRTFDPQGTLPNRLTAIDFAADGARVAVSMWGDELGTLPELSVFSPRSPDPIAEFPDGHSVVALDLSNDGRRLLATRANRHVGKGYTALFVQAYRVGEPDLRVLGTPSIGTSFTIEIDAPAGHPAFLLSSPALAIPPVASTPGGGLLHLDRAGITILPLGTVPAGGTVSHLVPIPDDPALIGLETHYQGLTTGPTTLTHDWESVLVLP